VEAGAALRRLTRQAGEGTPDVGDFAGLAHGIADGAAAIRGGQIEPVGHRPSVIRPDVQPGESLLDAHQAAHVPRVAVRIPAGGVHDTECTGKVIPAVQEGHDDEGMVRHHVAVASVAVIAVMGGDLGPAGVPIIVASMPGADVLHQAADERVRRQHAQADIQQPMHIALDKGLSFQRCKELRRVDRRAVVRDGGRAPRQVSRTLGVAGSDHGPAIDEDLRADLLGDD